MRRDPAGLGDGRVLGSEAPDPAHALSVRPATNLDLHPLRMGAVGSVTGLLLFTLFLLEWPRLMERLADEEPDFEPPWAP